MLVYYKKKHLFFTLCHVFNENPHVCKMAPRVCISCRELDGLLVEQCTVDTDATTGQSVPAAIGNYRKIPQCAVFSNR